MALALIVGTAVVGCLVTLLFSLVVRRRRFGLGGSLLVGVTGAFVGVFLGRGLGLFALFDLGGFLFASAIGALLLLLVVSVFKKRLAKIDNVRELSSPPADPRLSPRNYSTSTSGIFISYRRRDNPDVTGRIYDRLSGHFGSRLVFRDLDSIPLGVDFRRHLDQRIAACRVVLAVIGDRWLGMRDEHGNRRLDNQDDFVRIEIEAALRRGIPIIPVLVANAPMPREADLPPTLRELAFRNYLAVRTDPDFHKDVDRLIAGLQLHLQG